MAYFRNLFNRELMRPLVDFRPDELARVLARAARTADANVLREPEFQGDSEPAGWVSERLLEDMLAGKLCGVSLNDEPCADDSLPLYTRPPSAETSNDAKDHAVMQAKMWAQEARTQKAIVMEVGELVGCQNDWEMASAVEAVLASAGVPEGWKLVPIEPTESMMRDAADNLCAQFGVEFVRPKEDFARAVYRELLCHAPQPPKQEGSGDE